MVFWVHSPPTLDADCPPAALADHLRSRHGLQSGAAEISGSGKVKVEVGGALNVAAPLSCAPPIESESVQPSHASMRKHRERIVAESLVAGRALQSRALWCSATTRRRRSWAP